jgi:hypothetical protein
MLDSQITIAVLAHDEAMPTVELFRPQWSRLGAEIITYFPVGSTSGGTHRGVSAYKGKECVERFLHSVEHALTVTSTPWLCVMEYDTINLTAQWPDLNPCALNCGLFSLFTPDGVDTGHKCSLSPWIATRPQWMAFLEAIRIQLGKPVPEWTLGGLLDRMLGEAAATNFIQISNITRLCAYPWIPDAQKRIAAAGVTWVHGWKTKEDFGPLFPL